MVLMWIFEFVYPGVWLKDDRLSEDDARDIFLLFTMLDSHVADAAFALAHFHDAASRPMIPPLPPMSSETTDEERAEMMGQFEARRAQEDALAKERGVHLMTPEEAWSEQNNIRAEVERRAVRQRFAAGEVPSSYLRRGVFFYARGFLFALDSIEKTLRVIAQTTGAPPTAEKAHGAFVEAVPSLTGVRDSAHHPEDRARGLGKWNKPLDLKPIDNNMIKSQGGALVLDSLNGSRYGSTMADGHYGEVDVSPETLVHAVKAIQTSLDAFSWQGGKRYTPS